MLSGNGKDWNQGSGIWSSVPEHQDLDKKEGGEYSGNGVKWLKEWTRCWFSCSCAEFTQLFLLLQLHIFFHYAHLIVPFLCLNYTCGFRWCGLPTLHCAEHYLEVEAGAYSHEVSFNYFSGSERCHSESLGNLGHILGWVSSLVTRRLTHWFKGKSCLYPSSLSQFWFP